MPGRFVGQASRLIAGLAGVLLITAYFKLKPDDPLVLFGGLFFLFYGVAADTLVELSVGPKGIVAKFQRELIGALQERFAKDHLTIGNEAEAVVTHEGSFTADAVIAEPKSPDEFADLLIETFAHAGVASGRGEAHDATVVTSSSPPDGASDEPPNEERA